MPWLNKTKIYLIVIYFIGLALVWYFIKPGHNAMMRRLEQFPSRQLNATKPAPIIKSFGTFLRDKPQVAHKALLFRAIRPAKKRPLPKAYPDNDISSQVWKKYLGYLSPIGNQGNCGSCWAWSTSGALSDRFSLLSGGKIQVQLSPAKMVMCAFKLDKLAQEDIEKVWTDIEKRKTIVDKLTVELKSQIACAGNDLYSAAQELYTFGTTSMDCVPYDTINDQQATLKYNLGKSSDPSNIPSCWDVLTPDIDSCVDHKTAARIYRADDIYALTDNEQEIMQEIYRWGPVSAGFKVYEGFLNHYDGTTIYTGPKKNENVAGGHAIRIVGWGEENEIPYWWIANSWSSNWGMKGYFRMKRMIPECQLEQNVIGLKPEFPGKSVWNATLDIVQDVDRKLRDSFSAHTIDTEALYYTTAIDKIREHKLVGNPSPIISHSQLPNEGNYDNFWAADLISDKFANLRTLSSSASPFLLFIGLVILGVGIILMSRIGE